MNLRGIDLNLLTVLHAVLEEGHVTRAAVRLGLSQPATSSALERCRHLFGDPLVERVGNAMQLTPKGVALRRPLGEAIGRLEGLLDLEPPLLADLRQTVHLVMADALGIHLCLGLRERLACTAPGINLVLHPWSGGSAAARQLANGSVDLAVSVLPDLDARSFHAETVLEEHYVVAMRSEHPVAFRCDLEGWLAWQHIVVSANGSARTPIDDVLIGLGRKRRVGLVVPSFVMVPELLRGSDMIALLPERALDRADASIFRHKPPIEVGSFPIGMAWHRRRDGDRAVRYVADEVKRLLA